MPRQADSSCTWACGQLWGRVEVVSGSVQKQRRVVGAVGYTTKQKARVLGPVGSCGGEGR